MNPIPPGALGTSLGILGIAVVLFAVLIAALVLMAKWKSVIFSDIRNKLGESIIFSSWKGRGYMRKYTVPANPQTNPQTAFRALWTAGVDRWHGICSADANTEAMWNAHALSELISGFNKYMKEFMGSTIHCANSAAAGVPFNCTYTLGFPAATARILMVDTVSGIYSVLSDVGTLENGNDKLISLTIMDAGSYYLVLSDKAVAETDDTADPEEKTYLGYFDVNTVDGTIELADITIT